MQFSVRHRYARGKSAVLMSNSLYMLKKIAQKFVKRFFVHDDIRVKLFNILAFGGAITSLVVTVCDCFYNPIENSIVTLSLMFLSIFLLVYSQKSGKYQVCYLITIICVFLLGFPVLFFMNGGYLGGMPLFFIFAILFTILMLDRKYARIVAPLELCLYVSLCIFAYNFPETITFFTSELTLMLDVVVALVMASTVCGICLYLHFREFDIQKAKLAVQNEELQRHNNAKSAFLTTVAHEIRNPLTAISANARDSKELLVEEEQEVGLINANLETVEKIVTRIDRILIDLMDTVSIEQGRFQLRFAPVQLESILREAVAHYATEIKTSGNSISLHMDTLPPIMADQERLLQVMVNLLSNSLKHTRDGSISITLKEDDLHQVVIVSDTGDGMAKKVQKEVFKGYVSMSTEYWRHGIGLYVCNQIVTAHGGTIAFESLLGKGTSIMFALPKAV